MLTFLKNSLHYFVTNPTVRGFFLGSTLGSMATMTWVSQNQCSCSTPCSCSSPCTGSCPLSTGFYTNTNEPSHFPPFCFYHSLGCCSCKESNECKERMVGNIMEETTKMITKAKGNVEEIFVKKEN